MFTVTTGDSIDLVRNMATGSVDAVVTDPPYGMDFQSARRTESERMPKIANDKKPFIWWLNDAYRVTKETGALICFCNWETAETWRMAIEASGWTVRSQAVWDRINQGAGDTKTTFAPRHDIIWFASKGRFIFPRGRPASVLPFLRLHGSQLVHPNQKPKALMEYLCRHVCPSGGTVLDPFAGSGATGEGALAAGCNFIGYELDPTIASLARKRIAASDPVGVQGSLLATALDDIALTATTSADGQEGESNG